jgi:hypothetical protein
VLAQHRDETAERSAPTSSTLGGMIGICAWTNSQYLGKPDLVRGSTAEPNGGELGQASRAVGISFGFHFRTEDKPDDLRLLHVCECAHVLAGGGLEFRGVL